MPFKRQLFNTNFKINNTNFFSLKLAVASRGALFWHSQLRKTFFASFIEKHWSKLKIIAAMYRDLIFLWFPPSFLISTSFILWEDITKEKTINYYKRQHWCLGRKDSENQLFYVTKESLYLMSLLMCTEPKNVNI